MAFQLWVNDENAGTKVLSEQEFTNLSQRQIGFEAGQPASSRNVNSGLRQANLVACALMDSLNVNGNLQSFRSTLATDIKNALDNNLAYIKLSGSQNITGSLIPKNNDSIDLGSNDKRWKYVFCNDVNYNGQSLRDNVSSIINKITTFNTNIYTLDLGSSVGSEKFQGQVFLCKTKNITTCTFNFIASSFNNSTKYVAFNLYSTDANLGKYLPSSSYYNANEEHSFYLGSVPSLTGDGVGVIIIEWLQSNYAQIKVKFSVSRSSNAFMGQVVWFNDNEL